jgi:hypothetical protein
MSPAIKNIEPKAWLQELKSSRKLQLALASLVPLIWFLWPSSPGAGRARSAAGRGASAPLGDRQILELRKLPPLAQLDKAGELPNESRMYRDIFLFDSPPPPPPPPPKPLPPPPPPTPEELAAAALSQARAAESATKPANLRYLGYIRTNRAGKLGGFMRADEPVTIKEGDLANPTWRLVKLTDASAEFQNLKYADLKHKIDATEAQTGQGSGPVNQF